MFATSNNPKFLNHVTERQLNRISVKEEARKIFSFIFSMNKRNNTAPLAKRIEAKTIPRVSRISKYDLTIKITPTQKRSVAQTNFSRRPLSKEK